MAVNQETIAEKIFTLLKGFGFPVKSFDTEGKIVIDPREASRFAVSEPNILVRHDQEEESIVLATGPDFDSEDLRTMLKNLASEYLLNFDYRQFNRQITPKSETIDIARKTETDMTGVIESLNDMRKLAGIEVTQVPPEAQGVQKAFDIEESYAWKGRIQDLFGAASEFDDIPEVADLLGKADKLYQNGQMDHAMSTIKQALKIGRRAEPLGGWSEGDPERRVRTGAGSWSHEYERRAGYDGGPKTESEDPTGLGSLAKKAKRTIRRTNFGGDRSPEELRDQVRTLSDETLTKWANDTSMDKFGTGEKMLQDKLVKHEMKRRGLAEGDNMPGIAEGFGPMSGSKKTSHQTLENVKIVVKHRKEVNEEVRGSRSRNIHSIYIKRGNEQFKLPENNLSAARAMARHVSNGGEVFDDVGSAINEMAGEQKTLRRFVNYVNKAGLVNEANAVFVEAAKKNIGSIKSSFKQLASVNGYASACESVLSHSQIEILEDDIDLESQFTETHFDSSVENAVASIKASMARQAAFESKIDEAIQSETFEDLKASLSESGDIEFSSPYARLGHQVSQMSASASDPTLGKYLASIGQKVSGGGNLSHHEYTTVKSCLMTATSAIPHSSDANVGMAEALEERYTRYIASHDIF